MDYVDEALFNEPLVLLGEDGAPFFDSAKDVAFASNGPIWPNNHIHVLRVRPHADLRFVTYALNAFDYGAVVTGSTRDKLTQEDMMSILLPLPPPAEQRAIADFLDRETARIDALIAAKRRMIELVWARHTARAERVLFVDGVERRPLMRFTPTNRPIMYGIVLPGPDLDEGVPIVKGGNVREGTVTGHLCRTSIEIESSYVRSRLRAGDVVVIIRGAGAGRVALVPPEAAGANITQDVARVAPDEGVNRDWLRLVLSSRPVQEQLAVKVGGAAITGINIWDLKRVLLPSVSRDQQDRLARHLVEQETNASQLAAAITTQIDLLTEHRQALITGAVTGEVNVGAAA